MIEIKLAKIFQKPSKHQHMIINVNLMNYFYLKAPSGELKLFLICPLMPDTVRMAAPSNLATSRLLLNMPLTKAVFLNT